MDLLLQQIPDWLQAVAGIAAAVAAGSSVVAAKESTTAAKESAKAAQDLEKKALIVPLAEKMLDLIEVDPANPIEAQIKRSLNCFEMIGHLCDAGAVDEELVELIWGDFISRSVDNVKLTTGMANGQTGIKLLAITPKAEELAQRMKNQKTKRLSYKKP